MAGALRLERRLGQSLAMTPQLQQAIKLLRLSSLELRAYVDRQMEENPLLEWAGPEDTAGPGTADKGGAADADGGATPDDAADDLGPALHRAGPRPGVGAAGGVEETLADRKDLRRHVGEQIAVDVADAAERLICGHLIDSLDEAGWFAGDLDQIAQRLGCARARVESALARVQACDPVGVGARSLRECLALQLADRGRLDAPMERLLDNLALVARRDLAGLAARCGIDEDAVVERVRALRALDPKPGASFETAPVQTVVPDVYVRPRPDGGWAVSLNGDVLPRVLIDRRYRALVDGGADAAGTSYVRDRLQQANWLVRALDQRAATILKVATELVRRQDGFLRHGVHRLRPLTLRDVAESVALHESTVSRVTGDKYMATPRGTFELKYFFSAAIPGAGGDADHAAEAVRQRIRELIDAEPASAVLSDDRLAAVLRQSGIEIARRTIAKYRESLRIPSSFERRRAKSARI